MKLNKKSLSKGIIKDIIVVGIGVLVIWIGLQITFGTPNPFYVVASGSMIPVLQVYDVLVVQGDCFDFVGILGANCIRFGWYEEFKDVEVGNIIVFDRPSGHDKVIVHRVAAIIDDEPKTIRTKGDANPASIPGTDFPITDEEYIGKVAHVIPQVGYVTQLIKPPINYIMIVIVIGVMIAKQMTKKKNEKELALESSFRANSKKADKDISRQNNTENNNSSIDKGSESETNSK
jgi:signal peptidase